ncbi:MAG: DNA translocase FtsK 4TM domain-containing protein, partial [Flavobacteriaceae bacterium]
MTEKNQSQQKIPEIKRQRQVLLGGGLMLCALLLVIAFVSYLFTWKADFSALNAFADKTIVTQNLLSKLGALVSHFFIYNGVGLAAFLIPYLIGLTGYKLFFNRPEKRLLQLWGWGFAHILWASLVFGYIWDEFPLLSGSVG